MIDSRAYERISPKSIFQHSSLYTSATVLFVIFPIFSISHSTVSPACTKQKSLCHSRLCDQLAICNEYSKICNFIYSVEQTSSPRTTCGRQNFQSGPINFLNFKKISSNIKTFFLIWQKFVNFNITVRNIHHSYLQQFFL